ncbi:MAG: prohibitin family protein [Lachnospiraceae bacterium]|nr:prohibitin family protein [Ruminococcus sp.]MCM1275412.1 prohibitin family protein [Lachnospiraceae bacterium]
MQKFTTENNEGGKQPKWGTLVLTALIVVVLLIVLFNSFTVVNEGFIGVKYQFGRIVGQNLSAGLNFHIPFIEEIQQVDTREQVYPVQTDAYTSDTQTVDNLQLKLNYCYDGTKLTEIIRTIGVSNVESKLLVPNVAKISKDEIGKVKAEDLVQNRSTVQNAIYNSLKETLEPQGIIVTAFAIENLSFDDAFEQSIQAKVIAAQDALKMQNKTAEKEEEAKQQVIAAQAEADSQKIKADAEAYAIEAVQKQLTQSPNYIEYMKIMNWDGTLPQAIGTEVNPFIALDGASSSGNNNTSSGGAGAPAANNVN